MMPFDTSLSPGEEDEFQSWKATNAPNDSGEDYDFRGAFKAGLKPGPDGHWNDTYKKPNHPTFSDESIYSSLTGTKPGSWKGDTYIPFGGKMQTQDPVDTIRSGLQRLEMGQMDQFFDVDAHHQRLLTSGPFAEADARQAQWSPDKGLVQMKQVPQAPLAPLQGIGSHDGLTLAQRALKRADLEQQGQDSKNTKRPQAAGIEND